MTDTELCAHLARALGRPLASVAERRLALILGGVLASGGQRAEDALLIGCDIYARMLERGTQAPVPLPQSRPPGR